MPIPEMDFYHGAAFTGIVEHPLFTALNKPDQRRGHYSINADIRILVKYATGERRWQFTFDPAHVTTLREDTAIAGMSVYLCLVCGRDFVCVLNAGEIGAVLDLEAGNRQWIAVERPEGHQPNVTGSHGRLAGRIAMNQFPQKLFET